MHRDSEVARWYRRVDPSCFTTQAAPEAGSDTRPLLISEPLFSEPLYAARDRRAERSPAVPAGWLGTLARRLSASRA